MKFNRALLFVSGAVVAFGMSAQSVAPQITKLKDIYHGLSDNGKWAITEASTDSGEGEVFSSGGAVMNVATGEKVTVSHQSGRASLSDITDDGNIVVGSCAGVPAYWSRTDNGWTTLPLLEGYSSGTLLSVTPDGHYAVGYLVTPDWNWGAEPIMYDLTSKTIVETPNIPRLDMTHLDQKQNCFRQISADGRYILASVSDSYMMPTALCSYVYDRQKSTYRFLGFNDNDTKDWEPLWKGLLFCEGASMSHDGKWVTGVAYIVEAIAGSDFGNEYRAAFVYNTQTDEFKVFNGEGEGDVVANVIFNDGNFLVSSPSGNPYASMLVRSGNYYIGFDQIMNQVYGKDFYTTTGMSNTGSVLTASEDGKTLLMLPNPNESYLLQLSESLFEAGTKVDLLSNYTVSPAAGSIMSKLREVRLTFDRNVETNGLYNRITCKSDDGQDSWTPLEQNGWVANGKNATITFRSRTLREGVKYTINIPAGLIRLAGDRNVTSKDINITFEGRASGAVKLVETYPANEASVGTLDAQTNPICLTFNADLKAGEVNEGQLYRVGEDTPYCRLNILVSGRNVYAYPTSGQHLFNGTDYRVVIPAGVCTDLSGDGANEEISLTYHGSYVREISSDDKNLFFSNCGNLDDFILYDGDRLEPGSVPAGWGFNSTLPWSIVRATTETTDMALAAHSMFAAGGTSDDWMSTPQIFIPDEKCYISFQAQSYLNSSKDRLKVYVYANDNVYDTFTRSIVDDIRANGDLVFDEQLNPGATQEGLEGEWTDYTVSLEKYAGKEVYICFLNENTDQSAVFVDNVAVVHDLAYLASFTNSDRVVNRNDINIEGTVTIATEIETYDAITLVLKNGEGTEVDRIEETGLALKANDVYNFKFDKALPLVIGEINPYSVDVTLGDNTTTISGSVSDLTFMPNRKIVIEEFSGAECANCPLGIRALENIENLYPSNVIPVILRTYQGDPLGTGVQGYSSFLGMSSAPSGRLNRGDVVFPMISNDKDYMFSGAGYYDSTTGEELLVWLDVFRNELAQPAEAEVKFTSAYDESSNTVNVDFKVRCALNKSNTPINVFAVITENECLTSQNNNLYNEEDPDLGAFGKGGEYGKNFIYPFYLNDVAKGCYGNTYNGTGGLIPVDLKAGEFYGNTLSFELPSYVSKSENAYVTLMLIDPNSGKVINANRCALNGETPAESGVFAPDAVGENAPAILCVGSTVVATSAQGKLTVQVYTADGQQIAAGAGEYVSLNLEGHHGLVIVRATNENGVASVAKAVIR